jgi:hypothetical protein
MNRARALIPAAEAKPACYDGVGDTRQAPAQAHSQ